MNKLDKVVIAEKGDLSDNNESGLQITEDQETLSQESSRVEYEVPPPSAERLVSCPSQPSSPRSRALPNPLQNRNECSDLEEIQISGSSIELPKAKCSLCCETKSSSDQNPSYDSLILVCNDRVALYGWALFKGCSRKYCLEHGSPPTSIAQAFSLDIPPPSFDHICFKIKTTGHYCMECQASFQSAKRRQLEMTRLLQALAGLTIFVLVLLLFFLGKPEHSPSQRTNAFGVHEVMNTLSSDQAGSPAQPASSSREPEAEEAAEGIKAISISPSDRKISLPVSPTEQCKLQYHRSADGKACEQEVCNTHYYLDLEGKCRQAQCNEGFSVDNSGKHCVRTCPTAHFFSEDLSACEELKCPKYEYPSSDGEECLRASCSFGSFTSTSGRFCKACKNVIFADLEPEQVQECLQQPSSKHTFLLDYQSYLNRLPSIDYCEGELINGLSQPTLSSFLSRSGELCKNELELNYIPYPYELEPGWRWVFLEEVKYLEELEKALSSSAPTDSRVFMLNGFFTVDSSGEVATTLQCLNKVNLQNRALAIRSCFPILT